MNIVAQAVSRTAGRLLARPRGRVDEYAFCAEDRYWFRPAYTKGKCPLCGAVAPGGGPAPPLLVRMDRSWIGLALFTFVSVGMSALVLFMYFAA
ncbi:MAG TPA: hypothetical protein VFM96_01420 [Gaiellaceae bacterium]|nr:hypothetical protein [Gaiellaceae bacterium]